MPPHSIAAPILKVRTSAELELRLHEGRELDREMPRLEEYVRRGEQVSLSRHPGWLTIMQRAFGHTPYCLETLDGGQTCGMLPLAYVRSLLFGRFLVSLPFLNSAGVLADHQEAASRLIERAAELAEQLRVRYLELRHEEPMEHPALDQQVSSKVHMRLPLPGTPGQLWDRIPAKVRNQVRKGQKNELKAAWGGEDLLSEFYTVFSRNMRDLGTPVYGRRLFRSILRQFPGHAELCVVRAGKQPVAGALLLHGWGVTEVPSASSLRQFNHTCANMLMYWHLLERAAQRCQAVFDFGRSSLDSSTFRFKKQWGAEAHPAHWQYRVRVGQVNHARPDNPRYRRFIRVWQWLPVSLTRLLGPMIVRGIP